MPKCEIHGHIFGEGCQCPNCSVEQVGQEQDGEFLSEDDGSDEEDETDNQDDEQEPETQRANSQSKRNRKKTRTGKR